MSDVSNETGRPAGTRRRDLYGVRAERDIAARATELVNGDRGDAYGDTFFRRWAASINDVLGWDVTPHECAIAMALLKLVREGILPREDNLVDAIGYIILADRELHRDDDRRVGGTHSPRD